MRKHAQAKRESNDDLWGALLSLVLAAGVLLSLPPTRVATSFVEVGRPETVELVAGTPDSASPVDTIAQESPTLDIQLD